MIYEKCRDILLQESVLIQEAVLVQEKIKKAVHDREWTEFDDHFSVLNSIQSKIEGLEIEREALFNINNVIVREKNFSENLDAKGLFYALVSLLPAEQRNDLTSIYRSLKIESLKLRLANDTLMTYLNEVKSTLKEFFTLAFPENLGNTYTKDGTHFSQDMRSVVLNTSF